MSLLSMANSSGMHFTADFGCHGKKVAADRHGTLQTKVDIVLVPPFLTEADPSGVLPCCKVFKMFSKGA